MKKIRSKKSHSRFFVNHFVLIVLTVLLLANTIYGFWYFNADAPAIAMSIFWGVIMIPINVILVLMAYQSIKNVSDIVLTDTTISFGNRSFLLSDIKNFIPTGKVPFKMVITDTIEGTTIVFSDGTSRYIYHDYYSNTTEIIRQLFEKLTGEEVKTRKAEIIKNKHTPEGIEFVVFPGSVFRSFGGFSIIVTFMTGFLLLFTFDALSFFPLGIYLVLFLAFQVAVLSRRAYYLKVSEDYFLVDNYFPFINKMLFKRDDIKEIVIDSWPKAPNSLRIITKDFQHHLFPPAFFIRDKTWDNLKEYLQSEGIEARG